MTPRWIFHRAKSGAEDARTPDAPRNRKPLKSRDSVWSARVFSAPLETGFGVPASAGKACDGEAGLEIRDACCVSDAPPAKAGTPNSAIRLLTPAATVIDTRSYH